MEWDGMGREGRGRAVCGVKKGRAVVWSLNVRASTDSRGWDA